MLQAKMTLCSFAENLKVASTAGVVRSGFALICVFGGVVSVGAVRWAAALTALIASRSSLVSSAFFGASGLPAEETVTCLFFPRTVRPPLGVARTTKPRLTLITA